MRMNDDKDFIENEKLDFNTYCFFTDEDQLLNEKIGLIFKDYLENLKIKF